MADRLDKGGNTVVEIGSAMKEQLVGSKTKVNEIATVTGGGARSEEDERLQALKNRRGKRKTDDG
jgi:hypothetical protein